MTVEEHSREFILRCCTHSHIFNRKYDVILKRENCCTLACGNTMKVCQCQPHSNAGVFSRIPSRQFSFTRRDANNTRNREYKRRRNSVSGTWRQNPPLIHRFMRVNDDCKSANDRLHFRRTAYDFGAINVSQNFLKKIRRKLEKCWIDSRIENNFKFE